MNKKYLFVILLIIICLSVHPGCTLNPLKNIQTLDMENNDDMDSDLIIVGFSQLGSESDWRTANTKSIQNALTKENGFSLIFANGRQKQENQIKDVRSFIFQEVDYIVIAPVTETGWDTVLTEAKEAGIPVVIVDRMIDTEDESLYVAWVGTDKYEEGVKAGLWLEKHLKEKAKNSGTPDDDWDVPEETGDNADIAAEDIVSDGEEEETVNIVVLEGTINSTAQLGRSKGFEDIAARNKNWKIIAKESGEFTKAKGKEVMKKFLKEHEDINVLVSQNDDMTFGAIEAIHEAGRTCGVNGDIIVISFDAVSKAFDMMEAGYINVDIECNPLQGPPIADIITRLERGEKVPRITYVEGQVFEAENASKDRIGRTY